MYVKTTLNIPLEHLTVMGTFCLSAKGIRPHYACIIEELKRVYQCLDPRCCKLNWHNLIIR